MRSFLTFLALFIISTITTLSEDFWEPVNDLFGSSSRDIKFAPDGTAYMATESSGVYRSDDNGSTWVKAYNGIEYKFVENIAALDNGEIIIGTAPSESILYYSSDKGNSWTDIRLNLDIYGPGPFVFAINGEFYACPYEGYLHKLSEDKTQWIKANGIEKHVETMCSLGNTLFAGSRSGVYKSTDNGYNWILLSNDMVPRCIVSDKNIGRLYMTNSHSVLSYSDNYGEDWVPMSKPYPRKIFINSDGHLFYYDSDGILTSTDHGKSWNYIYRDMDDYIDKYYTWHAMTFNEDNIIAVTKYGPIVSRDNGKTWNKSNYGVRSNDVYILRKVSDGVVFASNEYGIFRSPDSCRSWDKIFKNIQCYHDSPLDTNSQGHIYTYINGYIYVSTNNGDDWTDYRAPICRDILLYHDTVFIVDYSNGIKKSYDLENWEEVNDGLPNSYGGSPDIDIRKLYEVRNNVILACPLNKGIYRSSNGGKKWVKSDKGIEHVWVVDLAMRYKKYGPTVIPSNGSYMNGDIFAATYTGCGSYGEGIYRSTDNGLSWELKSVGLKTQRFVSIIIGDNGVLYTGAFGVESHGVYQSTDNGETWLLLPSSGLPKKSIISLLEGDDGRLYAGVSGDALYRTGSSITGTTGIEDDNKFSINEPFAVNVFPNPARDMTNLNLKLTSSEKLVVSLYNTKGQLIKILADGYYSNEVNIPVDKGELPSGTYYLSIDSGSMLKTIKLNFIE